MPQQIYFTEAGLPRFHYRSYARRDPLNEKRRDSRAIRNQHQHMPVNESGYPVDHNGELIVRRYSEDEGYRRWLNGWRFFHESRFQAREALLWWSENDLEMLDLNEIGYELDEADLANESEFCIRYNELRMKMEAQARSNMTEILSMLNEE